MASMLTRRKHLGCAVFKNNIYVVGGRDDIAELNSAERYNPQLNQWQPIISMKSRRSGVGLAVVADKLYAIGGFDGGTYLKTVEVYDAEANAWKLTGSMIYRRLGGGVGVIKIQRDSMLFKPLASNPAESKQTIMQSVPTNLGNSVQTSSPIMHQAAQSMPNSSSPWLYNNQLPSLLANVPSPTNILASSSQNSNIISTPDTTPVDYNYSIYSSISIASSPSNSAAAAASSSNPSTSTGNANGLQRTSSANKLVDI